MFHFTIIIPHKDSPELLKRCLDSIPERDDLQIIIVDDNSHEGRVDFSHFPGLNRKNTECVFTKEGKGAGYARNIALSLAKGTWLMFADADDYFSPSLPSVLDKYADNNILDIVFFDYCKTRGGDDIVSMPITRYIENFKRGRPFSNKVLRYSAWSPWSRMIRRELQVKNNLLFEELPFSNDMMFVLRATSLATQIGVESDRVYYYNCPSTGTLTSIAYHNPEKKLLRLDAALKQRQFYIQVGYRFFTPIWKTELDLGIKAPKQLKSRYGFKSVYNLGDTLVYLIGRLFRFI